MILKNMCLIFLDNKNKNKKNIYRSPFKGMKRWKLTKHLLKIKYRLKPSVKKSLLNFILQILLK